MFLPNRQLPSKTLPKNFDAKQQEFISYLTQLKTALNFMQILKTWHWSTIHIIVLLFKYSWSNCMKKSFRIIEKMLPSINQITFKVFMFLTHEQYDNITTTFMKVNNTPKLIYKGCRRTSTFLCFTKLKKIFFNKFEIKRCWYKCLWMKVNININYNYVFA